MEKPYHAQEGIFEVTVCEEGKEVHDDEQTEQNKSAQGSFSSSFFEGYSRPQCSTFHQHPYCSLVERTSDVAETRSRGINNTDQYD